MPFLTRGKARSRINRPKIVSAARPPANQKLISQQTLPEVVITSSSPPIEPVPPVNIVETTKEEEKVSYQEITYRVPKEERLLDLPLEEEVFGEEEEEEIYGPDERIYNIQPVGEPVSIGMVLKKKKRR